MAVATPPGATSQAQTALRREILEFEAALAGRSDAEVLGVSPQAGRIAIRAAYVALVRRFHPDAVAANETQLHRAVQAIFVRVTQAYQALDGEARAQTDVPAAPGATAVAPPPAADSAEPPRQPPAPRPPEPAVVAGSLDPQARLEQALETAHSALAQGDSGAAVSALHPVLSLGSLKQRRAVRLALARAYVADARWQRYGLALLRDLTQENPADAEALTLLGGIYRKEGLLTRAEATFARALEADPGQTAARQALRALRAGRSPAPAPPAEGLIARLFRRAR